MYKKIIILVLTLAMCISLCACGSGEAEKKTLYMATEATFPPYEYHEIDEDENSAIIGIDVEIAQAVCDKLGYLLEVVDTDFDTIIPGVKSGKYDFGLAGLTVTEDRLEEVNFSDSYATGVQVIIVPEGSPITTVDDLFVEGANYAIGSQSGTTGNLYATWDIEDEGLGTVQGYSKTTDAIEALKLGKCDCVILDNEPAKALVAANPGLKILATEYVIEDYAACFAKENTELSESFNSALKALIADGTVQKIIDKYIHE